MVVKNDPLTFGEWVAKRRKALDLTQEALARLVGCSHSAIRKIESGDRRPSRQVAELLAERLEISSEQRVLFLRAARGENPIVRFGPASRAQEEPAQAAERSSIERSSAELRSTDASNLPEPATPMVGREPELAALARLLQDPSCRMLTLVGPGGIGKSRLALAAAAGQIGAFPDGVWYVPLGPLAHPEFIAPAIASALGFEPRGSSTPEAQLYAYLRSKSLLLVLENAEHLIRGIGFVAEILRQYPRVKLLFTSRERLRLQGEWVFEVHGLPFTQIETAEPERSSAVELFIQCARRVLGVVSFSEQDLRAVAQICCLVEGMPLAIELAVAWLPVLTCREIAREIERDLNFLAASIRDLPDRHRSIRAVFDHSWELLSEDERRALRQLAVFRGGFRRNAAEIVAGASLGILASLATKSLIQHAPNGRYGIHELIRQYANVRLAEIPEEASAVAERHAVFMLNDLASRERDLKGPKQAEAVTELTVDLENLRAAWRYAASHHLAAALTGAIRAFYWLLEMRSWVREAMDTFQAVVDALGEPCSCPEMTESERLRALGSSLQLLGYFCMRTGRMEGREYLLRSMEILREAGSEEALADAERDYGILNYLAGDFATGEALIQKALAVYTRYNDFWSMGTCHFHLGNSAHIQGQFAQAESLYRQSLADTLKIGDPLARLRVLSFLIMPVFAQGEFEEAERLAQETLAVAIASGDGYSRAQALRGMGMAAHARGDLDRAVKLYRSSVEIFGEFEDRWSVARLQNDIGQALVALGQPEAAWQAYLRALEVSQISQVTPHTLEALAGLATLLMGQGQCEQAAAVSAGIMACPAGSQEIRARAQSIYSTACQSLPEEVRQAVEQAAKGSTLDAIIAPLMDRREAAIQ